MRTALGKGLVRFIVLAFLISSTLTVKCYGRAQHPPQVPAKSVVKSVTTLKESGGRLDWSHERNLITFDRLGKDGYFDVYLMNPDGSNEKCLTCDNPKLPNRHIGNPAWHPSGQYIVFQAQKPYRKLGKITDFFANPGSGINNDVWVVHSERRQFWQLTNVEPKVGGVLHPHFSHKGDKLIWSERISTKGGKWGKWVLKFADFKIEKGIPRLANIKTFQPGKQHFWYETHGFNKDDTKIVFTGNLQPGQKEIHCDIYTLDIKTGRIKRLTTTLDHWDEHAHYSPSGKKIVWMSSMGLKSPTNPWKVRTEFWMMNSDGSNKERLTYFNDPDHPHYISGGVIAADSSWSPDGTRLTAYLILSFRPTKGRIVMIEFDQPL